MRLADQLRQLNKNKKPGMDNDYKQIVEKPNRRSKEVRQKQRELLRTLNFRGNESIIALLLAIDMPALHAHIGITIKGRLPRTASEFSFFHNEIVDASGERLMLNAFIQSILGTVFNTSIERYYQIEDFLTGITGSQLLHAFYEPTPVSIRDWNAFVFKVNANMPLVRVMGAEAIKTLWDSRFVEDIQAVELPELELEVSL